MSPPRFLNSCRAAAVKRKDHEFALTLQDAANLKDMWFKAYPELVEYFNLKPAPMRQPGVATYIAEALTGFKRGDCSYCAALNLPFQSLASSGSKQAAWDLYMAGYRTLLSVHDEFVVEVPEDSDLKHHYEEVQRIMVAAMTKYIKNVTIKTEAVITRRWCKEAKQKFDGNGYPLIWDDLPENKNKEIVCDIETEIN